MFSAVEACDFLAGLCFAGIESLEGALASVDLDLTFTSDKEEVVWAKTFGFLTRQTIKRITSSELIAAQIHVRIVSEYID